MLLFAMFLEIDAAHFSSTYQEAVLTRQELNQSLSSAVRDFRVIRTPEKVALYREFLKFSEQTMKGRDALPLLPLLLDFLENSETISADQASTLILQIYTLNTQGQENPVALLPLGYSLLEKPRSLVAFLRLLCIKEVKLSQIFASHVLQDFFRSHLNTLDESDSLIRTLYHQLTLFPETLELVEAAGNISVHERGFVAYSITGEIKQDTLPIVEKANSFPIFTSNEALYQSLYLLFDDYFLGNLVVQWAIGAISHKSKSLCIELMNQPEVIHKHLPILLNQFYEKIALQQALAQILSPASLQMLIDQGEANVLCLIPFQPLLVEMVQQKNLKQYLQQISQNASYNLILLSGVIELFNVFKKRDEADAIIIFESILEVALKEAFVFEDDAFIRMARKFSPAYDCIQARIQTYASQLQDLVKLQLKNQTWDYILLEDCWLLGRNQIQTLEQIVTIPNQFPLNKHEFYIYLAKMYYQDQHEFSLDLMTKLLNLTPEFAADKVTPYERAIIELLAALDIDSFRTECINILNSQNLPRTWPAFLYGDKTLFQRAVILGNQGLIQWLEQQRVHPTQSYDVMSIDAARANQWNIVAYFHQTHVLKTVTNNVLLNMAVKQRVSDVIQLLWEHSTQKPTANQIEQSLVMAVHQNDPNSIHYLLYYFKKPPDKLLVKGFKQAIRSKYYETAMAFVRNSKCKDLQEELKAVVIELARTGQKEGLTYLTKVCTQDILEKAFLIAARANKLNVVQYLMEQFVIGAGTINRARNEARNHRRLDVSGYLSSFGEIKSEPGTCFAYKNRDGKRSERISPTS